MEVDLSKITTNGHTLLMAYDQGLEHGPEDFLASKESMKPGFVLDLAVKANFNGIILQKGIAEKYYPSSQNKIPLIVKLNGKTKLKKGDPLSTQVCSVKEAKELGAIGVGYTIYLGSEFESKMLAQFGKIEQEAEKQGLIVIAWMYPRGEAVKNPKSEKTITYAARTGLELGADFVKVNYPGSIKALSRVVKVAGKTKVLVSGGKKLTQEKFFVRVKDILTSGAAGLAVGRNIWQAKTPLKVARAVEKIVHHSSS